MGREGEGRRGGGEEGRGRGVGGWVGGREGVVWCGVVWCGVVWCGVVVVWCGVVVVCVFGFAWLVVWLVLWLVVRLVVLCDLRGWLRGRVCGWCCGWLWVWFSLSTHTGSLVSSEGALKRSKFAAPERRMRVCLQVDPQPRDSPVSLLEGGAGAPPRSVGLCGFFFFLAVVPCRHTSSAVLP